MPIEDELTAAMRVAVGGFGPATTDLVAGGVARGRVIRRRRRARVVTAATMAAGVVVGTGFAVTSALGEPAGRSAPALAGGSPSSPAAGKGGVAAGLAPSENKIIDALREILPTGYSITPVTGEPGYAEVTATDAQGSVIIEVNVEPGMARAPGVYPCSARTEQGDLVAADPVGCTDLSAGSGAHLVTTTETDATARGAVYFWTADYGRADGVRVVVAEINSLTDKDPRGPSRTAQPLSTTRLAEFARSTLWPTS